MITEQKKSKIIKLLKQGIQYHHKLVEILSTNPRVFVDQPEDRPKELNHSINAAEECYNEVLKIDKNNYDSLRHLGILYLDQGEFQKAKKFFQKASAHHKNRHEVYNNLGSVFLREGAYDDALKCFQTCLKMSPNYLPAINNLAKLCIENSNIEDSIKYAELAYSAQPENKISLRQYANAKILKGDIFEGIRLLKDHLTNNNDIEALHLLAQAFKIQGNFKESERLYNEILSFDQNDATAFFALSTFSKIEIDKNIIDNFVKIAESENFENDPQASKIFAALYSFMERDKNFDQSIQYLHKMNATVNNLYNPNWDNEIKFISKLKKEFSEDLIKKYSKFGNKSSRPIFILGMPRSGTTLIEQILSSHQHVYGAGELTFLPNVLDLPSYNENNVAIKKLRNIINSLSEKSVGSWSNKYLSKLSFINNSEDRVTDKLPHNFIRIGLIKILFPNANIIYCKRDSMDNCFSLYRQFFNSPHFFFYDQKLIGQYYNMHEDLMKFWIHNCNINMYQLNHEELVDDPKKIVSDILNYCELDWDDNCMEFHKNKRSVRTASNVQVREPINRKSIQSWKKYEKELALLKKTLNYTNA